MKRKPPKHSVSVHKAVIEKILPGIAKERIPGKAEHRKAIF